MGVLARGSVADRPWGMTLGALGKRGLSGQLTLAAGGKQYCVAFAQGAVIGAYSPVANDAAVRLALTGNLITSSQVGDIMRRLAAAPDRDEVDVLAEACRLQPEQAQRLRRRLIAQRAARTFSVEEGEFVIEDAVTIPIVAGGELDVRTIIYLGARNNLGEERLAAELGQLGVWFKLKPEAVDTLPQYGFSDEEQPVLRMLMQGANLSDLQVSNAGLGVRAVRAVVYALATCGTCETGATPRHSPSSPALPRTASSTVPPANKTAPAPSQTVIRGAAPSMPGPRTAAPTTHKTAPLGSRSPSASAPSTYPGSSGASPAGRAPTGEPALSRSASASYHIPSAGDGGRASSSSLRAPTGSDGGRSSSPNLRAPTGGVATGRSPTPSSPGTGRASTGGVATGRSPTPSNPSTGRAPTPSSPAIGRTPTPQPSLGRAPTPSGPVVGRAATHGQGVAMPRTVTQSSGVPRATEPGRSSGSVPPALSRTTTHSSGPHLRPPAVGRTPTPSAPAIRARGSKPGVRRPKQSTAATLEIEALLAKKIPMLDQGVDYFTLFGLPVGASPEDVRSTYFMLARKLHPDRLAAIGVDDEDRQAQRLMACINEAFAVLDDPVRREEYLSILRRGGEAAVRAEEQKADELATRVMRAEEAFRQGEMALRRDQVVQAVQFFSTAVELQPNEPEYQALLAWAQFASATDKNEIAVATRKALLRAADANPDSPTARFYLGRIERMLGREKEALAHFHEVLRIKPNHTEAASEARILEQRLKNRR